MLEVDVPESPRDKWIDRFVARLRILRPSLADSETAVVALVAFEGGKDLDPEDAAAEFDEILAVGVPVGDLRRWMQRLR
jgi:hypothetical protein